MCLGRAASGLGTLGHDPVLLDPQPFVYHRGPVDIGVLIVVLLVVIGFALVDLWRHR